ncbi:MAG TPA: hypothetical protein DHV51_00830, partial [Opitutae bacterium]|nr:hypothetical protein [Opitutae bacterium]
YQTSTERAVMEDKEKDALLAKAIADERDELVRIHPLTKDQIRESSIRIKSLLQNMGPFINAVENLIQASHDIAELSADILVPIQKAYAECEIHPPKSFFNVERELKFFSQQLSASFKTLMMSLNQKTHALECESSDLKDVLNILLIAQMDLSGIPTEQKKTEDL